MKLLHLLVAICITLSAIGQTDFVQITPGSLLGQSRIDDIFFTSPELGFACDQGGKIRKITNYGATIEEIYAGPGNLRSIEFFNPDTGFVGRLVNSSAISPQPLMRTYNGGENWVAIQLEQSVPGFCGMHAMENGTIYASGAYFGPAYYYKSIDFGTTWTYFDMSEHAEGLVDVFFISNTTGFMGGQGSNGAILLKTENGGESWESVYESAIPTDYIWKIHALENNPGVLYAALQSEAGPESLDYIWSEDYGDTWESRHATDWGDTQDIVFIDPDTAFITGHQPLPLHRSVDGGLTWEIAGDVLIGNRFFIVDSANIYLSAVHIHKYGGIPLGVGSNNVAIPTTTFSIFPNPAKESFTIEATALYADHIIVSLLTAEGRYIDTLGKQDLFQGKNEVSMHLPDLSVGLYLLHLHTHSGVQIHRLMVD